MFTWTLCRTLSQLTTRRCFHSFSQYNTARLRSHLCVTAPTDICRSPNRVHCVTASKFMATGTSASSSTKFNRLAEEKSSYLQQHASNPVDWFPWGSEAFEKAKKEDKMIFLSVGYSTCHWCHVMERESFENEDVAKIMNEHYVSVKVDREERPDVDKVYMLFVQAISGGGGWPMSVWLTPDLKPIAGGTYFPPDDRYYGRPGFSSVLHSLARQWRENKQKVLDQGTVILDALMNASHLSKTADSNTQVAADGVMRTGLKQLTRGFEPEFGGFSAAPKFPQPVFFNFLYNCYHADSKSPGGRQALDMTLTTLRMMANGGIHDHVNKGFHRYSTDKEWHVPHFEKMLYDQAQLANSYMTAFQITREELFAEICRGILLYVNRDLSDESGGFYSAEDADSLPTDQSSHKKEGAFCVWTKKEIDVYLSEPVSLDHQDVNLASVFSKHFSIEENGNVKPYQDPHEELKSMNVLIARGSLEDTAAAFQLEVPVVKAALNKALHLLFDVRKTRPKPHLDTKMITSWNGLMISAFAKAGQIFHDKTYTDRAIKAATFLKNELYNAEDQTILRSSYSDGGKISQIPDPIPGFIDDYAFAIQGLINLYETTFDPEWLVWSEQLQDTQNKIFWDSESHAYFTSRDDDRSIVLRLKEDQDGAEPSGNSVSLSNLVKLASYLNRPDYKTKADNLVSVFADRLTKIPVSLPQMACGVKLLQSTPKQVIIVGNKEDEEVQEMLKLVHSNFSPLQIHIFVDPADKQNILIERLDVLKSMISSTTPTAYVCENFTCSLPVNSSKELEKLLTS